MFSVERRTPTKPNKNMTTMKNITTAGKYSLTLGFAGDGDSWKSLTWEEVQQKLAEANANFQRIADFDRVKNNNKITISEFRITHQGWILADVLHNGTPTFGFVIAL